MPNPKKHTAEIALKLLKEGALHSSAVLAAQQDRFVWRYEAKVPGEDDPYVEGASLTKAKAIDDFAAGLKAYGEEPHEKHHVALTRDEILVLEDVTFRIWKDKLYNLLQH